MIDATLRSLPAGLKHQLNKWVKGSAAMTPAIVYFTPCSWVIMVITHMWILTMENGHVGHPGGLSVHPLDIFGSW